MYYVYVIKSQKKDVFYKGYTNNILRRLSEHNNNKTASIKHLAPFKLIHVEICVSLGEAIKLEKFFKSGFGREIIQEINSAT